MDEKYEVYREVWKVTEWRDESIYHTVSQGYGWYDMDMVDANRPHESNLVYASPSTDHQGPTLHIRRKR